MSEIEDQKQKIRAAMEAIDLVNQVNYKHLKDYMTLKERMWEDECKLQYLKSMNEPTQNWFEEFSSAKIVIDDTAELLKIEDIFYEFKDYFKGRCKLVKLLAKRKEIKAFMNEKYPKNIIEDRKHAWRGLKIKATE